MADNVSESIIINATPKKVMAVIAALEDYPAWSDGFTHVEVVATHSDGAPKDAAFSITTPVGKDVYEINYVWDGHTAVSWTLNHDETGRPKSSMMKKLIGSYTLEPEGAGGKATRVTYQLEIDPKIPMMGFMKRKAAATIVDNALHGLKKKVESAG